MPTMASHSIIVARVLLVFTDESQGRGTVGVRFPDQQIVVSLVEILISRPRFRRAKGVRINLLRNYDVARSWYIRDSNPLVAGPILFTSREQQPLVAEPSPRKSLTVRGLH